MEESELLAAREREDSKELKEELLIYKMEAMEQHEKGFNKAIRQAGFFAKDLDLGLLDLFKDVKDGVLLDKEYFAVEEEVVDEEQGVEEQGDDATIYVVFCLFSSFLHCWNFGFTVLVIMIIILFSFTAYALL